MEEDKVKNLFEHYDTNKNGVLDKSEFYKLFGSLLQEIGENFPDKKNEQVAEEAIQNFDLNGNGIIEYEEFYNLISFLVNEKGYKLK